ncbi:MAG: hypothetical protein LUD41_06525 [Phascolarctobacterium sp.]|nr:hypothetical protein [Phascolarctobacterium sp.]
MKKIFALILIIMLYCQTCGAFNPPDPNRWVTIQDGKVISCWLDAMTIRFDKKYGENYANVWVILNPKEEPGYSMDNMEFNMDKREFKSLSITKYDDNRKVTDSSPIPSISQGIPPGTLLELLYQVIAKVSEARN